MSIKTMLSDTVLYASLFCYSPALCLVAIVFRLVWGQSATRFPSPELQYKQDFLAKAIGSSESREICIKCGNESTSIIDFDCPHFLCGACAEKYFESPWQPTKCLYCSQKLFRLTSMPILYAVRIAATLLFTLVLIQAIDFGLNIGQPRKTAWPLRAFCANVALQVWLKTEAWDWDRVLAKWELEHQRVFRRMLSASVVGLALIVVYEIVLLNTVLPAGVVI